jgi:hypothetical protein
LALAVLVAAHGRELAVPVIRHQQFRHKETTAAQEMLATLVVAAVALVPLVQRPFLISAVLAAQELHHLFLAHLLLMLAVDLDQPLGSPVPQAALEAAARVAVQMLMPVEMAMLILVAAAAAARLWEVLLAVPEAPVLSLFDMQIRLPLLYPQPDRLHTLPLAGIVFISLPAPARLLGDAWRTLHNLTKTTSCFKSSLLITKN